MEKLNHWLTLISNVTILIGLILVAVEINDNTRAVRSQEVGALHEMSLTRQSVLLSENVNQAYTKSLLSPGELTFEEMSLLINYIAMTLNNLERSYMAYTNGIITEEDWNDQLYTVPIYLGTEFGQTLWVQLKNDYSNLPDFVDALENALANSPVVPDDEFYIELHERLQESFN